MKIIFCASSFVLFLMTGCTSNLISKPTTSPNPTEPASAQPTQGDPTLMPAPLQTPAGSNLDVLIEQAKQDLAQRLPVPAAQINLVAVTPVEWNDSSLGCAEPGTDYLQVITPGYLIVLEVNGAIYEYHSKGDIYFIYCANPNPPILPSELK